MTLRTKPIELRIEENGVVKTVFKEVIRQKEGDYVRANYHGWGHTYRIKFGEENTCFVQPVRIVHTVGPFRGVLRVEPDRDDENITGEWIKNLFIEARKRKISWEGLNGFYFTREDSKREVEYHVKKTVVSTVDLRHRIGAEIFLCRYVEIPFVGARTIETPQGTIMIP